MILVDYSAVSISAVTLNKLGADEDLLRHLILNTLKSYNRKYRNDYGEMVLCMDHRSWRKDVFPNYKARRLKDRKESDTDWDSIFKVLNNISNEIKEFIPWRVLHVEGAEGDDCIATMAKRTQEFGKYEDVLIIASDKDYIQLQKYKNVKQWSPITNKIVKADPIQWLEETIIRGQVKDGVPSIRCDDDFFLTEGRAPPITKKYLDSIKDLRNLNEDEKRRYERNKLLLDFDEIPKELNARINKEYEEYKIPPMNGMLNYLIKKRCANLAQRLDDFRPNGQ